MSSPNHDDLAHLKIPLENILSATNNFAYRNFVGKGRFDKKYKGQLSRSGELIKITARRFTEGHKDRDELFWTEVSTLSSLKHKNLVTILGFCDEKSEKIIIYKNETARGRLDNYLSDPLLTWVRRLEISVGLAHVLSYIHYDEPRDFSVIHRNIKSDTVLLSDDWEPKLSDFECSMKIEVSQRYHSFHNETLQYTDGYGDPTYIETRSVSHKSDMYSFGIVLFELLCGRRSIVDDLDNKYLATVAVFHYKEKTLDDIIDPDLWKQIDPQSLNVFAETAYVCLNEEPSQRPNIDEIVTRLQTALKLQFECQKPWKNLEYLKIAHKDIKLATENFADKYRIGSGAFGKVYKAQLEHFDSSNSSLVEGENKCDFPKKRSTVAIKRIYNPLGEQGFDVEIQTLSSCKHKNIISLLGFCYEGSNHMILVYEHASKGSLEDYMANSDKMIDLTWMRRLKICLDIAHGLNYIHTNTDQEKQKIIHRDIKSANILLGDNWVAKIADFGLSKFHPADQDASTLNTSTIAGTNMYLDPEYQKFGRLNKKSDIYSFGVVLFEILTGRVAYDRFFTDIDKMGIAPIARHHFGKGTLKEIVDPKIMEEIDKHVLGTKKESLDIFAEIAYRCLAMTQVKRPSIDDVITELEKAISCGWKIALNDIELATENFHEKYRIGSGAFGTVYGAQLEHYSSLIEGENKCDVPKKRSPVAIKRINNPQGEQRFNVEIETLASCKHENIISLLGFCDEDRDHMILVYEFTSKGSLEDYMGNSEKMTNFTWMQRLKICLGIALGLNYIHNNTDPGEQRMIQWDIKSANILFGDNWEAKIADFGLSISDPSNQGTFETNNIVGTRVYQDPEYEKFGRLNKKSDIYSFGVVLFEILTGRVAYDRFFTDKNEMGIAPIARDHYEKRTLTKIVDHKIMEETDEHVFFLIKGPNKESLDIFTEIAFKCLAMTQVERPSIDVVINELEKALSCQRNGIPGD